MIVIVFNYITQQDLEHLGLDSKPRGSDHRRMERLLGYAIGGALAVAALVVIAVIFGGAIIAGLSAALTFPIAAPMTTLALIVVILMAFLASRRGR